MTLLINNINVNIIDEYEPLSGKNNELRIEDFVEIYPEDEVSSSTVKTEQMGLTKILNQTGNLLGYADYIPGLENYVNREKLKVVADVCKLPSDLQELQEGIKVSLPAESSQMKKINKAANLTATACKVLATSALLIQPVVPVTMAATVAVAGGYLATISKGFGYINTGLNLYDKIRNKE